jgi:hypothetical protein
MAVTVTPTYARGGVQSFQVTATADADVAAVLSNSLPFANDADAQNRLNINLVPMAPEFYVKAWRASAPPVVGSLTLSASNTVGGGAAGNQINVTLSILRAGSERPGR